MCEMCFQIHTDECGCSLSDTDWSFYVGRRLKIDVQSKYWPSETDTLY